MSGTEERRLAFLVDTDVWVDFFIDRGRNHDLAASFLILARKNVTDVFTPVEATKDLFFIVKSELKRLERAASGAVTEQFSNAVEEVAWSALDVMRRQSTVVGADQSDMIEAIALRGSHNDYEDNLVIAAAKRARATHIVSSDKQLQKNSPIPCISLEEAVALLK